MAKTPSLNASIREVGISPTLNSLYDGFCRLFLYSAKTALRSTTANLSPQNLLRSFGGPPPYREARPIRRKEYGRRRFIGTRLIPQKVTKMTHIPAKDRKVVQVSTMVQAEKDWAFIALCDDGSMWLYHGSWSRIENIPQTADA